MILEERGIKIFIYIKMDRMIFNALQSSQLPMSYLTGRDAFERDEEAHARRWRKQMEEASQEATAAHQRVIDIRNLAPTDDYDEFMNRERELRDARRVFNSIPELSRQTIERNYEAVLAVPRERRYEQFVGRVEHREGRIAEPEM
jgi:hypothetical protein